MGSDFADALAVTGVRFSPHEALVTIRVAHAHRTTPELAAWVAARRPDVLRHACANDRGRTFGDVIDRTTLPHLLEHVLIDILIECTNDPAAVFVGASAWADRSRTTAQLRISWCDDLAFLRALKEATALINEGVRQSHAISPSDLRPDGR